MSSNKLFLTLAYRDETVFHASTLKPSGLPYLKVGDYYVTKFNPGRNNWVQELDTFLAPITALEYEALNGGFKIEVEKNPSRLLVQKRKDATGNRVRKSGLIDRCIDYAKLDPNMKVTEFSCHTKVEAKYMHDSLEVSYRAGLTDFGGQELRVSTPKGTVLSARDVKESLKDFHIIGVDRRWGLEQYLPGNWEQEIKSHLLDVEESVSVDNFEQAKEQFGL